MSRQTSTRWPDVMMIQAVIHLRDLRHSPSSSVLHLWFLDVLIVKYAFPRLFRRRIHSGLAMWDSTASNSLVRLIWDAIKSYQETGWINTSVFVSSMVHHISDASTIVPLEFVILMIPSRSMQLISFQYMRPQQNSNSRKSCIYYLSLSFSTINNNFA